MEASSALSVEAQTEPGTYFDEAAKPTGEVQVPGSMPPAETAEATQEFVASHEASSPAADQPAPVEGTVMLVTGREYVTSDLDAVCAQIEQAADWVTIVRTNGTGVTVALSAIVSYE